MTIFDRVDIEKSFDTASLAKLLQSNNTEQLLSKTKPRSKSRTGSTMKIVGARDRLMERYEFIEALIRIALRKDEGKDISPHKSFINFYETYLANLVISYREEEKRLQRAYSVILKNSKKLHKIFYRFSKKEFSCQEEKKLMNEHEWIHIIEATFVAAELNQNRCISRRKLLSAFYLSERITDYDPKGHAELNFKEFKDAIIRIAQYTFDKLETNQDIELPESLLCDRVSVFITWLVKAH